jgi:hypothetical protein
MGRDKMKHSVMAHFGFSLLESGLAKKDLAAQATGLMVLAEFTAAGIHLQPDAWPTHVARFMAEGIDSDMAARILPEALAAVITRQTTSVDNIVEQAFDLLEEGIKANDETMQTRALMAIIMRVERDALDAGEQLELEERVRRAVLEIPPRRRPTPAIVAKVTAYLDETLGDREESGTRLPEGYVPIQSGTPLAGELAIQLALSAFQQGDEDDRAAALYLLSEESRKQAPQGQTLEESVEATVLVLREQYNIEASPAVIERAKTRNFSDRLVLVGGPPGAPPGVTLH